MKGVKNMIDNAGIKSLSAAVLIQAAKDYKDPAQRESIEKWVENGNMWCDISLPGMEAKDIIGGFKRYAKVD